MAMAAIPFRLYTGVIDTSSKRYQAAKANQKPHPYAAEAWQSATDAGIMDGTKPQSPLTREQLAVILQRLCLLGKGVK